MNRKNKAHLAFTKMIFCIAIFVTFRTNERTTGIFIIVHAVVRRRRAGGGHFF